MTSLQTTATTDPQSMAALQQRLDAALAREATLAEELAARTAELAERNTDYSERIEQQAGTVGDAETLTIQNQELRAAQAAGLEVLQAMVASPSDTQPVFDLIARQAADLCDVPIAAVAMFDGRMVRLVAQSGFDAAYADVFAKQFPRSPSPDFAMGRAIVNRRVEQIEDTGADTKRDFTPPPGPGSALAVPLLRNGAPLGVIAVGRRVRGSYSKNQITLLKTFAEQAVIAISSAETYNALQERTEALTTRNSEYGERIEQQTATIDVLRAMSASPTDLDAVFDLIVRRARGLCDANAAALYEYDGDLIHRRARDIIGEEEARGEKAFASRFPMRPGRDTVVGRVILERRVLNVADVGREPGLHQSVRDLGGLSAMGAPLLRDGQPIGAIVVDGKASGGFSESQIALLRTFAEQAVIAISSAETYRALQTRTSDLQETLEYQTATGDVLKVISRSTFDLQPVLDTVAETAAQLCDAEQAAIYRREGDLVRLVANCGFPPEYEAFAREAGAFPFDRSPQNVGPRAIREGRPVHLHDVTTVPGYGDVSIRLGRQRTSLGVPLLRDGEVIGSIVLARQRVEPFTDRQIELVSTFADQAVIAIENTRLITEQREALEQQTATAEVLQVINSSPGNLAPVFDAILERALRLCGAAFGMLGTYDGARFRWETHHGLPDWVPGAVVLPEPGSALERVANGERVVHIPDLVDTDTYRNRVRSRVILVDKSGARAGLWVALRKDDTVLGVILIYRREPRAFSDKQIALLENFAAQAVIAMENARLINEQREALEQQTATAEVLQVINASPGDLVPVFDAILEKAHNLCDVAVGSLSIYLNGFVHTAATRGFSKEYQALLRRPYPAIGSHQALMRGGPSRQTPDFRTVPASPEMATSLDHLERMNLRTGLWVPLRKDGTALGCISLYRDKVQPFSEKEIALLENFAAQAVIAMENARLLDEIRQRQEELRVTFDNMGDGVAMFDTDLRLTAWNRNFQRIIDLRDTILETRPSYADYLRLLAERGEFGTRDVEAELSLRTEDTEKELRLERVRPDGRVIEVRRNAVPGGGFVLIYSDITERKRSEEEIRAARDAAEEASRTIEVAYRELKTAQANMIQAEKMASLGQLTAGIAHEIKNPLNFVNNFAALSVDLLSELKETAAPGFAALTDKQRAEVEEVSVMLTSNLEKITEHGKRADGIVKAMLEHSRGSSGERRMVDLNVLIDEALNLAYHGARAQDQSFNITLERDFGAGIAAIEVNPQDITRVFLNLFANGFYAATRRARDGADAGFVPTLKVTTRAGEAVEIRVRDNGIGIPVDIRDKLFQPFFTTKPTGEGTGLGLSITYDIVTKQHGGTISVDSVVDAFTEFVVTLPRQMFANGGDRA